MFAFLFTDIEGSTALLQRVGGDLYAEVLAGHHALIRSALAAHGGREVDTAGDGFFAVFPSPRRCVAAALEMQHALAAHSWPTGERVRVRMGMHAGEAEQTAAGLVGLDVHLAARIAAVAHGGQVVLSHAAGALVRDRLPEGVGLKDLGVHRLKDLGRPEQLFQLCGLDLEAEFPPLRSLGNPALPNNLPAQLASFVGRAREMAEVAGLVKATRLLTLTGAGGAGKTRLALQVAAGLLDGWSDGVWLAELAAVTDPDAVPAAIATALRIPAQPGRPALDGLADALGPQEMLVVLDNCEHLIGGCAKTVETVLQRCQKVHLMATSREPLGIAGERIYRVPSLSLPDARNGSDLAEAAASCDAVALLADRAWAQGVRLDLDGDTVPVVVSVCARLDGMPLAIELAAARLRSMSLAELTERLDQRFRLLTGGSRTALERQQTLRAAIGWSYALLTGQERLLLGRLSVFAGGFDLAAAEAVCGHEPISAVEVAGLVGSLVDKSLVVAEPTGSALRYRLLETIRLFAAERLADDGEAAAAAAAHCAHYLAFAETTAPCLSGPDQADGLARLDTEHANLLRAAQHAAAELGGTARVLRFGIALWRYWYWIGRSGGSEEAAGLLLPVLRRPEAPADPALFAEALWVAAFLTSLLDRALSLQLAEHADEVAHGLGDDRLLAMTRGMLCIAYSSSGDPQRARLAGHESVQRARKLRDDVLLATVLQVYAWAVGAAEAGPLYTEAFACTQRSGDVAVVSVLHTSAGVDALELGHIPAGRAHLEAAIAAAEVIGEPHLTPSAKLAEVLRAEHNLDDARSAFEYVVRVSRRIGDKHALADAILGLACIAADLDDWQRASALHGAEQALLDQMGKRLRPFDARRRRLSLDRAAAALGEQQFQRAYTQGMALSFDQAIDLALRRARWSATEAQPCER
ncbi:MAG TPA: adenylate/guanylate cyclase domain-containing protein [Streptosporangiaceae bacterium]|nr:adenylate/guanylate cyclase domain-containing protein [Streptosporangiaceae bacterium]